MINLKENKKIIIYCRLGNEEENNSSYNIELENIIKKYVKNFNFPNMFQCKNCYMPYRGYYDLKEYNLTDEEFKDFWKTQYLLKCCEKNVNLIKSTNNNDFEKIKEISAIYQNNLLKKELKDKDIEIEY